MRSSVQSSPCVFCMCYWYYIYRAKSEEELILNLKAHLYQNLTFKQAMTGQWLLSPTSCSWFPLHKSSAMAKNCYKLLLMYHVYVCRMGRAIFRTPKGRVLIMGRAGSGRWNFCVGKAGGFWVELGWSRKREHRKWVELSITAQIWWDGESVE